ncbi:UNKNOWN [Stylonychia lemnae]|uniref:Uncharacterized protein n=1 Tax=Stylonychia lemnae TaxID=5949 RepID=A0A077ZV40_STYLE|nr:UNKNOWN [Stylonychia lemnae]|eukprot:CDW73760.1 UNKNOWN [Stylonychia lemnae]
MNQGSSEYYQVVQGKNITNIYTNNNVNPDLSSRSATANVIAEKDKSRFSSNRASQQYIPNSNNPHQGNSTVTKFLEIKLPSSIDIVLEDINNTNNPNYSNPLSSPDNNKLLSPLNNQNLALNNHVINSNAKISSSGRRLPPMNEEEPSFYSIGIHDKSFNIDGSRSKSKMKEESLNMEPPSKELIKIHQDPYKNPINHETNRSSTNGNNSLSTKRHYRRVSAAVEYQNFSEVQLTTAFTNQMNLRYSIDFNNHIKQTLQSSPRGLNQSSTNNNSTIRFQSSVAPLRTSIINLHIDPYKEKNLIYMCQSSSQNQQSFLTQESKKNQNMSLMIRSQNKKRLLTAAIGADGMKSQNNSAIKKTIQNSTIAGLTSISALPSKELHHIRSNTSEIDPDRVEANSSPNIKQQKYLMHQTLGGESAYREDINSTQKQQINFNVVPESKELQSFRYIVLNPQQSDATLNTQALNASLLFEQAKKADENSLESTQRQVIYSQANNSRLYSDFNNSPKRSNQNINIIDNKSSNIRLLNQKSKQNMLNEYIFENKHHKSSILNQDSSENQSIFGMMSQWEQEQVRQNFYRSYYRSNSIAKDKRFMENDQIVLRAMAQKQGNKHRKMQSLVSNYEKNQEPNRIQNRSRKQNMIQDSKTQGDQPAYPQDKLQIQNTSVLGPSTNIKQALFNNERHNNSTNITTQTNTNANQRQRENMMQIMQKFKRNKAAMIQYKSLFMQHELTKPQSSTTIKKSNELNGQIRITGIKQLKQ